MYKVLIVDDEPIILSGIKFLIDWDAKGCQIVGTARNGQQALEEIEQLHPNIVICDIGMPVLSGLEVLKQVGETNPEIVFVMLTNHQDFELAREAMRFKAVDYLLKTQLEAEALEKSLVLAIEESDQRRKLAKVSFVENYISTNKSSLISENITKIVTNTEETDLSDNLRILHENEVLTSYSMLEFLLDYSLLPNLNTFTTADKKRVFEFQKDMIEKLVCNFFPSYATILPETSQRSIVIFVWNIQRESFSSYTAKLYEKLGNASDNITNVKLSLLVTDRFSGEAQLQSCYSQLMEMADYYYSNQCTFLTGSEFIQIEYTPLNLSSQTKRLTMELNSKNVVQIRDIFEKIQKAIEETPHRRDAGISFCIKLYSIVSSAMVNVLPESDANYYLENKLQIIHSIQGCFTKKDVLEWINKFKDMVLIQLEELFTSKSQLVERACEFILKNIDKHLMLQEVANQINISPSYLSALFKKQFNQNFIDYINMKKTERACELIQGGQLRIYEISYMLGFENAYYFTKVFKRNTGMTPTEYQFKCKAGSKKQ